MINQLLNMMYHQNIQIKEIDNITKLLYAPGQINDELKKQIIQNKAGLLQRLDENEQARKTGFLIYNHGQLYEYRYGLGAYLYIERLPDGKANTWRENYLPGQQMAYKTKGIVQNVPFLKAYLEANRFIDWLKKQKRKAG